MKTRRRYLASSSAPPAGAAHLRRHPLCVAALLALSGGAQALPNGATVVAGQASVQTPSAQLQVVTQGSSQAIIDWKSFSIAAGEKVRFDQPSASAVMLNRVTGYDPSSIFGQMQANGRVFLLNPYGVLFGAGARIDVGGLVASSLSLSNADFLASRYSLTSVDPAAPARRGEVRNDGVISAPGGTVALVAPSVTNSGTIVADRGRVGLAAATQVSVDVEGDGLIFFQTSAGDAQSRLAQLGRIQADGGSIELRAAVRGAFADTVLNMTGIVQARSLGTQGGQVVIDGGESGITRVAGTVDVAGAPAGEKGGRASVTGYDVLIDRGASIDARGAAGGGTVLVGGNWQGQGPERNADQTIVNPGARIDVSGIADGAGGTAVVWADYRTQFRGEIAARGGELGGDGGRVETSGRQVLQAFGTVDLAAPRGKGGSWLLDPNNIDIKSNAGLDSGVDASFTSTSDSAIVDTGNLGTALNAGANVTVTTASAGPNTQSGDITVQNTTTANLLAGQTATLTLRAQRNISFTGATIQAGAGSLNVNVQAGTDVGATNTPGTNASTISMDAASVISTGTSGNLSAIAKGTIGLGALTVGGNLDVNSSTGNGALSQTAAFNVTGTTTLNAGAAAITLTGANTFTGAVSATNTGANAIQLTASGALKLGAVSTANNLTATGAGISQTVAGLSVGGNATFDAGTGTIALATPGNDFGGNVTLKATGASVSIADTNALTLAAPTLGTNTAVTAIAGTTLTLPAVDLSTGTGSIDLRSNNGTLASAGKLTTGSGGITLVGATGLSVGHALTTTSGPIALTGGGAGGLSVAAGITVDAGSNTISAIGGGGAIDLHTGTLTTTNASASAITVQNATTVALGNVSAANGTVAIGVGADISGTVSQNPTTGITADTLTASTAGTINLNGATNAIANLGAVTRGGAFTLVDTGALAVTGDMTGGTTTNAVSISTTGALTLGASSITTSGAGNNLSLAGVGVGQTTGALAIGGATTVNAGSGSIDLRSTTNDFTGAVNLTASGGLAAVRSANDLQLGTLTLGTNTGIAAIAGGNLSGLGSAIDTGTSASGIDLRSLGGTLTTPGNLTTSNAPITLVGASGLTIANNLASSGGAITLTGGGAGGFVANANKNINAGSGTITVDGGGGGGAVDFNNSQLTSTSSGAAVTVRNATTVAMGDLTASSGTVTIGVAGDVTGAVTSNNGTTLAANTLAASTGSTITLGTGPATLTVTRLGPVTSGNLTLDNSGALALAGAITPASGSNASITAGGLLALGTQNVTVSGAGTLTLKGVGVTQTTGAVQVASTSSIDGGNQPIDLQSGSNHFGGAVTLKSSGTGVAIADSAALALAVPNLGANTALTAIAGTTLTMPATAISTNGDLDLRSNGGTFATAGTLHAANIALTGSAGITIGHDLTASGGVSLTTTNSAVSESAGATITTAAASTFATGTGSVTLSQANSLSSIGGTGGAVTIFEGSGNGVALDAITASSLTVNTSAANGAVTQTASTALTVSGATSVNAGNGPITLDQPGNALGSFGATGGVVSVANGGALALDAISATSLAVDTSAANAPVTQNAALAVTGLTTVKAGTGGVTLTTAGNALGSFGATGGAVSLREDSVGGIALDNVVAASLLVDTSAANGTISQTAAKTLAVAGAAAFSAGSGTVNIGNAGNTFGSAGATASSVTLRAAGALALDATSATTLVVDTSAANGAVTQNAALAVTGLTTVNAGNGDITLTNAGNDFSNAAGINAAGGGVRLRDANALLIAGLTQGANKDLSLTAGTMISGLSGNIDTGTANLTLSAGTLFTSFGTLRGTDVSITGSAGISLGHDVTALGNLALASTNNAIGQTGGHITATAGTTTVTAGSGTVTLNQATNDFNAVNVVSGSTVTIRDANALAAAAAATGPLTVNAGGVLSSSGALSGTNVALTGAAGISLGHNVTATGTLQLGSTNAPIAQTGGAISAGGLMTVTAGSGDITLTRPGNDFADIAGVDASGGAVRLADANALTIANLSVGLNKDLSLTAGTALSGVSGNIDTGAGNLALSAGTSFATFGSLRGTDITLFGGGGLTLGHAMTALGNLTLGANNAPITQTAGTISAAGTTTANAGSGAITLNLPGNDFSTFAATGGAVNIRDANGLALGPVNATTLTLDSSGGNGAITSSGPVVVSGTTTITTGSGAVSLGNPGNNFSNIGVSGGAVTLADQNAIVLNAINAASLAVDTSAGNGAVTQAAPIAIGGAVSINAGTGPVTFTTPGNAFASFGATGGTVTLVHFAPLVLGAVNATTLNVDTSAANGAISQNAPVVVGGTTTLAAGSGAITLTNPANDFGSVVASGGAVRIADANAVILGTINAASLSVDTSAGNGAVTQTAAATVPGATTVTAGSGAIALGNAGNDFGSVAASGGAVSIRDLNAVTLGAINASSLSVDTSAGNGAITQTAAAVVSGASTINAGGGAVSLSQATNDFGTLNVTGGAVAVVDANALTLSALTSGVNQPVSVTTGGALTLPPSAIDTGIAALTLTSGGPLTTVSTLRGTNVTLASAGAMTIANNVTALGPLTLTTTSAPVAQTGGSITVAGSTSVDAGSGDITLAQASNNYQGNVALRGGAIAVRDVDNFAVSSLVSGADRPVTLVASGTLTLPAAPIDTGAADLALQSLGGTLAINGAVHANNVTLTGAAGLTLGADITSSGAQVYTTPVLLGANVALDSGASRIDLQGGVNGAGHDLTLTSTNIAADAVHTGAAVANVARLTVAANATLGGNVTTTGDQTYAGVVTLATNATLDAGAARIALQSGADAGGHSLALASTNPAADAIRADAAIVNATQLDVTGTSTLASGVTTSGAQHYTGTVTLGGAATFSASSLAFDNGLVTGGFALGLQADTLTLLGAISGGGDATLASATPGATVGVAGGPGTFQISQTTLDGFAGFAHLTIGRNDGTGALSFGNFVLPTDLAVQSASGNVVFAGSVASAPGQARSLAVTTGGTTTFGDAVGGAIGGRAALGTLSVAGTTALNASTTSIGSQTYGGPLVVGANATLSGSAVSIGGALDVGTHAVTLLANAVNVAGPATGGAAGSLQVAPQTASDTMGLAGGTGTLQVPQALLNTLAGVPALALGRNDSTAGVNVGSLVLPSDLAIANGSAAVAFAGAVDSAAGPARNLTVTTTGTTSFAAPVGGSRPVATLAVGGPVEIGASITASGAQTYGGPATLTADSTLGGPSVTFSASLDGAHALTVNAPATTFGAAVGATTALTSLTTDAAGTTRIGGNVSTVGAQTWNDALVLDADAVLAGSTLALAGRVDGAHSLALNGSSSVGLAQRVGSTTPLAALSTNGPLQLAAPSVTTTGAQTYAGPVTLAAASTLGGSSLSFGASVDGAFGLVLQSPGTTFFAAAVGATTPLASLTSSGAIQLNGPSVQTSGAQSYGGAVQVGGDARFSGASLGFLAPVSGARDLTLQTNALTAAAGLDGTGVLTVAPVDPALSIGVAGGAGSLQVSQAVLDTAAGFAQHVIGRTDGSGTLTAGALQLRANTTLQSGSGDVRLNGAVDGAFDLVLNSGGVTRIAGPIGASTPLRSLTTDNNAGAADFDGANGERTSLDVADATGRARVVTTGTQTYGDPVVASVPILLVGSAITADRPTNRFDLGVAATADTLQLHSATPLRLDDVTVANGGRIETDGVLQLARALRLNGGTLVLVSNAAPTSVPFTDPELQGRSLSFAFVPLEEATATIVQNAGSTIATAAGSLLALRSPQGGTLQLEQAGNALLGTVSAVSGKLGDNDPGRFNNAAGIVLGFVRIASNEIHVAGAPPTDGSHTATAAGIEGDAVKLSTDVLTTGTTGQLRARLPFNNTQGSQTSVPGLTLVLGPAALATTGSFGSNNPDTFIQVQLGADDGGFLTVRPKGAGSDHFVFLGGRIDVKPFYDGSGKLTEIRVFYDGDAPRTPQETGALAAVYTTIEDARHALFEEAVRTENVSSRLRSGVIAEVGAGRPATVGRESIRPPETCNIKPGTLRCE